jgi:hypothetical protein
LIIIKNQPKVVDGLSKNPYSFGFLSIPLPAENLNVSFLQRKP